MKPHLLLALLVGCAGRDDTDAGEAVLVRPVAAAEVVGTGGVALAAGDLLGDAAPDPVVGDPYGNRVCVWDACVTGPEPGDLAGTAVAAGDLDGDGAADLIVGGPGSDLAEFDAGAVWLVRGPVAEGSLGAAHATFVGEAALDAAGSAVVVAGDVNGDGALDLAVGAPGNDAGGAEAGLLYVFHGPIAAGTYALADANTTLQGAGGERHGSSGIGDALGASIAAVGDIDGDGFDDLVVSAGGSDQGALNGGRAALLLGPIPSGHLGFAAVDAVYVGERQDGFATEPVARAGDLDGDGRADVVLAENAVAPERLYVFFAAPSGPTVGLPMADVVLEGAGGDAAGWDVAGPGDTNGDGADDLLVGAPLGEGDVAWSGVVYVVAGPLAAGSYDLADAPVRITGTAAGNGAGRAVAGAGDVDGDGRVDVLVGAPYAEGDGRVWLLYSDW